MSFDDIVKISEKKKQFKKKKQSKEAKQKQKDLQEIMKTPDSIDSVDMAMDLYQSQPLKASDLSGKDIKRLERLKRKANESSGEKKVASKVIIDQSQSDISGIE